MTTFSRRTFIKAASAAAAALKAPDAAAAAKSPHAQPDAATRSKTASPAPGRYGFLNAHEASFIEAAVARLIPNDELGPGAVEAGVPSYIDKQLGGAWGAGERLYRSGPWQSGAPTQGYQLAFTPAELFRHALRGIDADVRKTHRTTFARLAPQDQDAYLSSLEKGTQDLNGVPANVFFESLLEMTIEGYFSDPTYGGNKDMAAWRMIGFPGAYANYYQLVDQHGVKFTREPMSLAENGRGHISLHPQIPAYLDGEKK
jgi:gluconate 2-dehydrogenase gamma chain